MRCISLVLDYPTSSPGLKWCWHTLRLYLVESGFDILIAQIDFHNDLLKCCHSATTECIKTDEMFFAIPIQETLMQHLGSVGLFTMREGCLVY